MLLSRAGLGSLLARYGVGCCFMPDRTVRDQPRPGPGNWNCSRCPRCLSWGWVIAIKARGLRYDTSEVRAVEGKRQVIIVCLSILNWTIQSGQTGDFHCVIEAKDGEAV
jgi:hypothetical protein